MPPREVLLFLTDRWADWEASFAIAEINSVPEYVVKTIATDRLPKTSIGGIRAEIDYCLADYQDISALAMVILPGGFSWKEGPHGEIADFIRKVSQRDIPVAAICGATVFLGKHGFLDHVRHTGDDLDQFLNEPGYHGGDFFVPAQLVRDKRFITANETASVAFAREIFLTLKLDSVAEIDAWYDRFQNGAVREEV